LKITHFFLGSNLKQAAIVCHQEFIHVDSLPSCRQSPANFFMRVLESPGFFFGKRVRTLW